MSAARLPAAFWARVAAAPHRLLMLDYDGTLAPHRRRRAHVTAAPGARDRLDRLSRRRDTTLAIVSGRRPGDLDTLLGDLRAIRVAEHGWEERLPDGRRRAHRLPDAAARALAAAAARTLRRLPPERLEAKRASIVLHTRGLTPAAARVATRTCRRLWKPFVRRGGLRLDTISGGLELRAPHRHKGMVVRSLLALAPAGTLPVFVGDDRTDEDAFAAVARRGVGIRVGATARRSRATARLASPRAVVRFLDRWLAIPIARRRVTRGRR